MKLRVRVNKQTVRLELEGDEPTLTDLNLQIREILLPSYQLSPETEFTLSLNGQEPLSDSGQTLSSCGVVSGDLVSVILPQATPVVPSPASTFPSPGLQTSGGSRKTASQKMHQDLGTHGGQQHSSGRGSSSREEEMSVEMERQEEPAPCVLEPMLCSESEEGMVPHSLEVLHHAAQSRSPCDSLMVAIHLLMLETGFLPQGSEVRPGEMPGVWRAAGGVYRLQYSHPLCESSLALVLAVPMGPIIVINASVKINELVDTVRKLSLKPSSYVTDEWAGDRAAGVYKDLKKLSRIFKDQLAYPLITAAREAVALPAVFGLPVLPPELLLRVLRLLDVRSLVALSSVSRDLHIAAGDPALWRHVYYRDFRGSQDPNTSRDTDWKELYKKKYMQRLEAVFFRRTSRPYQFPPTYPFPHGPHYPVPTPFYPPGIIGGEYDQRPNILPGILPSPRYDPIGPLPGHDPSIGGLIGRREMRLPGGNRAADIRRGFI